jgi:hypothetical protein
MSQQITIQNAGRFALAGNAIITMVRPQRTLINGDTETVEVERRFTYRIQRAKPKDGEEDTHRPWFVKVLSGPQNTSDYQYLGTIFSDKFSGGITYRHGRKSKIHEGAASARGIAWFVRNLDRLLELRVRLEKIGLFGREEVEALIADAEKSLNRLRFYHEGRCGKCARVLTVPASIELGLGPVCAAGKRLGILDLLARI